MQEILDNLKANSNNYKNINWRKEQLAILLKVINNNYDNFIQALKIDLGKCENEATFELENSIRELKYTLSNLDQWINDKPISTELMLQYANSSIMYQPYGLVLIIGPFNYPVSLTLLPLIGAISAGNSVVIKPSEYTSNVSNLFQTIINKNMDQNNIKIINGGIKTSQELIEYDWDYVFFTGSTKVGRIIIEKIAPKFIPYTLELGGKNSVLIDPNIKDIDLVAKKIVWAKLLNCGQTCLAPDIIISTKEILTDIKKYSIKYINQFYSTNPQKNNNYGRIINKNHHKRIIDYLEKTNGNKIYGGRFDESDKYIEPTIIEVNQDKDILLEEEIFGPILILKETNSFEDGIKLINELPQALNLYLFSNDLHLQNKFKKETKSGNVVINDLIINFMNHNLPFGGYKHSGIGKYGGKSSFLTFSNQKSVMVKYHHHLNDIKFRYPPYTNTNLNIFKWGSRISLFLENYGFLKKPVGFLLILVLISFYKKKI